MKNSSNFKSIITSIRGRPRSKMEDFPPPNPNLKHRIKLETSFNSKSFISEVQSTRKLSVVNQLPGSQAPSYRINKRGSFAIRSNTEEDQGFFDSFNKPSKNKDVAKLHVILPEKGNLVQTQQKSQTSTNNNSQQSTGVESDIEGVSQKNKDLVVKEEVVRRNSHLRFPSTCKAGVSTNITDEILCEKVRKVNTPSRIPAVSIEKREVLRAFALQKETIKPQPQEEENQEARESYRTLTSAYNSNKTLGDFSKFEWNETEDTEKIIKEVVEKNVEEAYKNIGLIKQNFQRKSKTYLFYIYKDD